MLTLFILLLFQNPLADPNLPKNSNARQELSGNMPVKHGKVHIPFFPPFAAAPGCSLSEGVVVKNTAEFIELKSIKAKYIHYDCHGRKKDATGETE
jgi:hypothetical protein